MNSITVLTTLAITLSGSAAAAESQIWGCYDPQPGHPTTQERQAYVTRISSDAVLAERRYGVPASAMAAMAILESGYGWTRTALNAQNIFGWKYVSSAAASARGYYVLDCQPPEDVGNRYVVFKSFEDAVDFVSMKLATLPAYAKKTAAYRTAVVRGDSTSNASKAWISAIADPYNWKPAAYAKSITRVMNDPLEPSDQLNPETNLFRLEVVAENLPSGAASAVAPASVPSQDQASLLALAKKILHAYPSSLCGQPNPHFERWEGFPVTLCKYAESTGKTTPPIVVSTYMLNPDLDKLATWTVNACLDGPSEEKEHCVSALSRQINTASSGVFPVAGYIPESASSGGGQGSQELCYMFRDGVTVRLNGDKRYPPAQGDKCPDGQGNSPEDRVTQVMGYGRLASTTRDEYRANGGTEKVGEYGSGDPSWLDVVRSAYQSAWTSQKNSLFAAKSRSWAKGEWPTCTDPKTKKACEADRVTKAIR